MVLINRYLRIFQLRNKSQRRLLFFTRIAAGLELLILFLIAAFFMIRFGTL
jgi:hypothetical protein